MKIRAIGAMLNTLEFEGMFCSDFRFENRFVGNFITREITKAKLVSDTYNSIVIVGCKDEIKPTYISEKFLVVEIPFDRMVYESAGENLSEVITKMYEDGIEKANQTHEIPYGFVKTCLDQFRKDGYKNEWEFKSRTFRSIGVKATLFCKMTIDKFSLMLILAKKDKIIFSEEIFGSKPSETQYHSEFKDIVFELGEIKVLNRAMIDVYSIRWPLIDKGADSKRVS